MGRHTDGAVLDNATPEPRAPHARTTGDKVRFVLRGIGQTLITFGLVVLLFVFYEVYVTNWFASAAQATVKKELKVKWDDGGADVIDGLPAGKTPNLPLGQGIANLYIPRLGRDYAWTIVQGTSQGDLEKGPGHYVGSALPGQKGNFAVAGHRVGKGEPFLNLDHLRAGDAVIVETEQHFFIYTVLGDPASDGLSDKSFHGIPGREIIDPSDSEVIYPVPDHPLSTPLLSTPLMTMTTCHPKFTASHRMIYHARLTSRLDKTSADESIKDFPALMALYTGVS